MPYLPAKLRIVATGCLVIALAGCAATPSRESTGEYFDDTSITTRVKADLLAHRDVSAAEVNVETFKGRVQLSGFVKTPDQKRRAGEIARSVKGVNEVVNDILIR
ncbi:MULTISPECIES: BON domain-containing protein [unclassified Variovorax]|uniref:BON domain-containing protein n=1 Tax=unclassified Variovorax TaxID=663243 RepID=UPI000D135AA8|nr:MULTISPECIES: BON domain-containing protein [unclassified Variovorax]AVQ85815.1 transporter [Variovorax sp. PMC12]QRY35246.1 BON domain-containing protein [Variovorax sp. PDNC026]